MNLGSKKNRTYDAIVIGSGISGGWAAKELTEKGLKTLVLERGRSVEHLKDYPTTNMLPWEFKHRGKIPLETSRQNPIVSRCNAFKEDTMHFFVKDREHPYVQKEPFDWIRGYQVGGRSLIWARQTQRWSEFDFEGPDRDGFAVDWPIRYKDLAPWYSHVEKFVGISGNSDGLPQLPDGEFLSPMELSCVEKYFKRVLAEKYENRHLIIGRCAHLTNPEPVHTQQGRGQCLYRTLCNRGCPFGGYFSSNSSTLPWAAKTGNLTLRPDSVVHSIIYDEDRKRASGVRVVDANTNKMSEYHARLIFVNASTLNTNLLLLNSTSKRFPEGLGNDNGLLGKYVAFHIYQGKISAEYDGLLDSVTSGRRPTAGYIPRFRNVFEQQTNFLRGYASTFRAVHRKTIRSTQGLGESLKENLLNLKQGPWYIRSGMMGETIPKKSNKVTLNHSQTDEWGIPLLNVSVKYDENDEKMIEDFFIQLSEMYEKAGFKNIETHDTKQAPGLDIHEMGGVRMGRDPKTSLLNEWNQLHACKNVFVSDGACMTSTGTQNPSLTYMALTARAANYAFNELKKRNL